MKKDCLTFKDRFQRWKNGELVYENGRVIPHLAGGTDGTVASDNTRVNNVSELRAALGKIGLTPFEKVWLKHLEELVGPTPQISQRERDINRQRAETRQWNENKKALQQATDEMMLGIIDPRDYAAEFGLGWILKAAGSVINAGKTLYKGYKISKKVNKVSKEIDKIVDDGFVPNFHDDQLLYRTTTEKELSALKSGNFKIRPRETNHNAYGWRKGAPFYQPGNYIENKMVGLRNGISSNFTPLYLTTPVDDNLLVRVGSGGKYGELVPSTTGVAGGSHPYYNPTGGLAYDWSSVAFLPGDTLPTKFRAWRKVDGKWQFEDVDILKTCLSYDFKYQDLLDVFRHGKALIPPLLK